MHLPQELLAGDLRKPEMIRNCSVLLQGRHTVAHRDHLSIPLAVGERTLGVMNLIGIPDMDFVDEDLQVLETAGNQIAIALEQATLYAKMEALVKERTDALEAERNLLSAVVKTAGALVLLVDASGRVVLFNPACEQALGWKAEEVMGRYYWDLFLPPGYLDRAREMFEERDVSRLRPQLRTEWMARDGSTHHLIWTTSILRKANEEIEYFLGTGIDVTELRRAEEKVQYLNNFDVTIGLQNRILLRDRVKLTQERIAGSNKLMGFLLIHFLRLPLILESLGPWAEHAVLLQITERLKDWAAHGDSDSVARLGDKSFAAIAVRANPEDLSVAARQILARMAEPFEFEQQDLHIEASIGITIFPNDGDDYFSLMQRAEVAMRRAMLGKKERFEFYRPELNQGAHERFKLESGLRRALARNEFVLHYQPQVDLRTGRIIGLEALLRWQPPELGLISPGRFIGLAEETDLILPIGEWVLRNACQQSRAWQDGGLPKLPVAVNLSPRQFSQNIPATVRGILAETGLDPAFLEFELTESLSMEDPESTCDILHALKEMGVQLAIDDFGTGYSNLNYLKRFPVDKLKLDQSFVRELTSDPDDLSISRAVIAMAHSLRLRIIAEGVETEGQLALLVENGCDEMQGYLFSKPVDAATCARLMRDGKSLEIGKLTRLRDERRVLFVDNEANMVVAVRQRIALRTSRKSVTRRRPVRAERGSRGSMAYHSLSVKSLG